MSVVLRVWGRDLDVASAIDALSLDPCSIARSGERKFPHSESNLAVFDVSGVGFCVSDDVISDFTRQVEQTVEFLEQHLNEVQRLVNVSGVDEGALCFGITRRDDVVQVNRMSPRLVALAGKLGLGIDLSHYPTEEQQ